jgi:mono/diheme cytochrome c family protein
MGKRLWITAAIVAVIGGVTVQQLVFGPGPTAFAGGKTVSLADYAGADPTGVPAALAQLSLVQRGEYLTKAADCQVCHTAKDGAPYAGGFVFKLPFGAIYSTNITPDRETGIGA